MMKHLPACFLIITSITSASAEDWTEFRGPGGQGHSSATNLPLKWSTTENVRWKVAIPGNGWSSPVVSDGRIYLTTSVLRKGGHPLDRSLRTLCLEAGSGKVVWNIEVFNQDGSKTQRIHRKNSHASPTPIIDGKNLFIHFGTQGTACLTLDGELVWKTTQLKYTPQHGNGGSPALVDDLLIINCDGADVQYVVALDQKTGDIRWKKDRHPHERRQKFSFSTPLLIEVKGRKQIISPGTNHVVAYDPRDGREIWFANYDGYSVIPRPVFGHGMVYVSTCYNNSSLIAIRPTGTGNVTESHVVWKIDRNAPHTPSSLLIGNELYFVSDKQGIATCVDAKTGKVHWQRRLGGGFSSSPIYADGKIFFQSEEGATTVVKPGKSFIQLAKNQINERTLASFAVLDSALLIRTEGHLYRIEAPTQRALSQTK